METLTRLVAESLARHGFDRPVDYRRLQWSRWFRCESHHSLLIVPSKPGVFALAEEIMDLAPTTDHVGTAASDVQRTRSEAQDSVSPQKDVDVEKDVQNDVEERRFSGASGDQPDGALAPVGREADPRRMLAVSQFFEDDDMAFTLDRMLSHENPMRARLTSGRYFVRYVVIEDATQRSSICSALNQWIVSSAEKATGIGSHFASSLELTPEPSRLAHISRSDSQTVANPKPIGEGRASTLNSAIATNIHCSSSFPSGF